MEEHIILIVLLDPKIALGDAVGRVVVDVHQERGGSSLPPGMITESLAQRMAADVSVQTHRIGRFPDDAVGLGASQRAVFALPAGEEESGRGRKLSKGAQIAGQSFPGGRV